MKISSKIPLLYDGFLLIDYLVSRFTYLDRDAWQERVSQNRFMKNDDVLDENSVVLHNDIVFYDMPDFDEPAANFDYKIIKQSDDYLVIDKPAGLMVHKHGINFRNNLIYHLRKLHEPPFPSADIVNRLDKNTSGIVLIALNKKSLKELLAQFAKRTVIKTYYAVVLGTPDPVCGEICAPIGRIVEDAEKNNKAGRFCEVNFLNGKSCQTKYETIKSINGHSLVRLFPRTGRTHQIRIHLSYIKTPIIGDTAYGMKENEYKEFCKNNNMTPIETPRHLLHCCGLEFVSTGDTVIANSDLPQIFEI